MCPPTMVTAQANKYSTAGTDSSSAAPQPSSQLSSSSFICRLCYHDVPTGDRCKNMISGIQCKFKGPRLPSQAIKKSPPKPPTLHTKGAAEILQQQEEEEPDEDDMNDELSPEEQEVQFLETSLNAARQLGLTSLVKSQEALLEAAKKAAAKEPRSQLDEAKDLQVVVTDQAA